MERLDTNVCAFDGSLQEAPKVFEPIGVDIAVHVFFSVVNNLVRVLRLQIIVGLQGVRVKSRTSLDILSHFRLKIMLLARADYARPHLASVPFKESKHYSFPGARQESDLFDGR